MDDNTGYCLVWDNVHLMSHVQHHSDTCENKIYMWALCFAAKNRIDGMHLKSTATKKACELPMMTFLPGPDDFKSLKDRMLFCIRNFLKENMTAFAETVTAGINHHYRDESAMKSKIVNLGVYDSNPSSIAGVISIIDKLHEYVPTMNGKVFPIPCHGDGLSVERMRNSQSARAAAETEVGRLMGLEPAPQEFHKRCILLQDTMDMYYSGRSAADRRTLFQIRNRFKHRNVTSSVNTSYNHIVNLVNLTTQGLVCLFAMKVCRITNLTENTDENIADVANRIVDEVRGDVKTTEIQKVVEFTSAEDEDERFYEYCFCKEDVGGDMVKCSNLWCPNVLYHLNCVGLVGVPDIDWWCSADCSDTGMSKYCICHQYCPDKRSIRCANSSCKGQHKYHLECMEMTTNPGTRWRCSFCKTRTKRPDYFIYNYTCSMLFGGLKDMAMHLAVKENNGAAMMSDWKLSMVPFWEKNHNKYLIIGHKLLADTSGCLPERLANKIIHNRTANLRGGSGNNIPLDLVNEFLNRDFKENMKTVRGRYTDLAIDRNAQLTGTINEDLDKNFQRNVSGTWTWKGTSNSKIKGQVAEFVEEYLNDNLVVRVAGRQHPSFPGFTIKQTITNPGQLKQRN